METQYHTDPEEFMKFNKLLTAGRPDYQPFYFPLERGGKDPWANISWKNNRKTVRECCMLMSKGYNIGVAARKEDPLVIIDVDDMTQVPEIKTTLQVISRKRMGRHNYFFAKDKSAKKNIATGDAGEVRACWQYVVAPGSFVQCGEKEISKMPESEKKNAGKYSLNNELPVSEITFEEFPEVYKKRAAELVKDEMKKVIVHLNKKPVTAANGNKSALWDLTISDVSGVSDTGGRRVPMPSEIHGSETGKNCLVSNGLMHCWRHSVCHNAFSYLAIVAGILPCERAGMQHEGRYFGADATDGETVYKVWKYAKDNRMIPANDPIPKSALIHYAIKKGICKREEAIRTKELTEVEYRLALIISTKEGLNFGRK